MASANKRSQALREIEEREGRYPTIAEVNEATRLVREDARARGVPVPPDEDVPPGSLGHPYQREGVGGISPFGRQILESQPSEGDPVMQAVANVYEDEALGTARGDDLTAPLATIEASPSYVSTNWSHGRAQIDGIITGDGSQYEERAYQYSTGADTVQDELIEFLEDQYNKDFIDQGVLENLYDKPVEEQIARLQSEVSRLGASRIQTRNLLAMNMVRQGLGGTSREILTNTHSQLEPVVLDNLWKQYEGNLRKELNEVIDRIAAREGAGFTGAVGLGEVIQQDVVPFYGATTRILGTNRFVPDDVEINVLRRGFPGEVRQEIRNWWVQATHEERLRWLEEIDREWTRLRRGPHSRHFTRYLVVENLMGLFTDELMYNENPKDSFDRVMGNLDTALGMLVAVGLVVKRGRSIFDMFSSNKENPAKQVAEAAGARVESEALDQTVAAAVQEHGLSIGEANLPNLPKPQQLVDEAGQTVETDTVKHSTAAQAARKERILQYTDQADMTLLDEPAKASAVVRELDELDAKATIHVMHKMSSVRGLDNGVGVEITTVAGAKSGEAWDDLGKLFDDMREMDPYQEFEILRRGADGKLEKMDISWDQIIDYYATGRIPYAMEEFIESAPELAEVARFFGGRRLAKIPTEELSGALDSGWVPPSSPAYATIRKHLNERVSKAGPDADTLALVDGEELFVRFKTQHYYNAQDMQNIEGFRWFDIPGVQTAVRFIGKLFPPNVKFGKLYEAARQAYHMEEAVLSEFADMLVPFDKLSTAKKVQVEEMVEWVEDYARDMYHTTGQARAPTVEELIGEFSHFDDDVFEGYIAMRESLDGLYEVFNRRLYRDFSNRGFVTIRGADDSLPNYHGKPMQPEAGHYYDPLRREMVELDADEIADIFANGGGAIKLDFAIDTPSGHKTSQILARKGEYDIGKLSDKPLNYFEGYHFRFYEDPYFVIKRTYGATVDGKKLEKGEYIEEAVRTAGSRTQAENFITRGRTNWYDNGKGEFQNTKQDKVRFVVQRSRSLSNTEGTLYQKQAIHREGRMFWDQRSYPRLLDTTGNRAKISDPFQAMQKGLAMAMRQTTQESLFDAMKVGFTNEFKDLPIFLEKGRKIKLDELDELEKTLKKAKGEVSGDTRARYRSAIEYIRYMRSQMGTDSFLVPELRAWSVNVLEWLDRAAQGKLWKPVGTLQKHAMQMDPFARARKIAYGAFMVLRPVRQLLLQSMQVSMLTGLAPVYIGSGKIFLDALSLRRGLTRFRRAGFDDGWSDAKIAKSMGLSKKEYRRLVEEFQRSGLLGSVNTHAFNASGRNLAARLPSEGGWGRFKYNARAMGRKGYNTAARMGFEWGEQNNLTFSYLIGLRRVKKRHGIKDLTKMTREQWTEVASEADALALAMTRPNKFAYQSGATGMMFQFLSFQHRAFLTFLGMNPKLSGKDTAAILFSNYVLWGSNIFGGEEWAREWMAFHGLDGWGQQEVMPGITAQDVMVAGIIETGLNGLLRVLNENNKDLNLGILAPGAAIGELYQGFYDLLTSAPTDMEFLGPFSNQASGFIKGAKFIRANVENQFKSPGQKLLESASMLLKQTVPMANDILTVWTSAQLGEWVAKNGDSLGIQTTVEALIARGFLGLRPEEELSIYRARRLVWSNQENVDNWVKRWRPVLKEVAQKWIDGEYSDTYAYELASVVHGLTESAPEGVRRQIYQRLMSEPDESGRSVNDIVAEGMASGGVNIRRLQPHIDNSSLPPEKKRVLKELVEHFAQGHEESDEYFRDVIQQQLEERGLEDE